MLRYYRTVPFLQFLYFFLKFYLHPNFCVDFFFCTNRRAANFFNKILKKKKYSHSNNFLVFFFPIGTLEENKQTSKPASQQANRLFRRSIEKIELRTTAV